jgi:hypothetical protein
MEFSHAEERKKKKRKSKTLFPDFVLLNNKQELSGNVDNKLCESVILKEL